MTADIVIKGGTVVDGTGAPGRRADVAVTDGIITGVGDDLSGRRVLQAEGHVVTPGFIDIHSHYDAQVFWDPGLTPSVFHGVTSVVAGNCGFTIAPVHSEHVELLARTLQHVEDMSLDTLRAGVPWDEFETFPQYLDAVARRGTTLNYGAYIGHTALRIYVMGDEGYERAATAEEIATMRALVGEALDAGALGFATSASPTHNGDGGRPIPSRKADLAELRELMMPMKERNKGVAALLPGAAIPHPDMFELQAEIGRPFTWTALLTIKGSDYHEQVVAAHDAARARGIEVWPQVSCRPLVFQMNLIEPFTFNMRACFAELMDLDLEARKAAYRDPAWRARAHEEMGKGGFGVNYESMVVAESARHPELVDVSIPEIAQQRGVSNLDALLDVALEDELETRFWSVLANNNPEGIAWLLPRDNVLFGLADSGAHVSQLCDACFATDLLGNWVRDKGVMPLERAIHKLTAEPAGVYGFTDRGRIAEGMAADLVAFDPATVAPGPLRRLHDFPAHGERLTADAPTGMLHTLVNGVAVRADGAMDDDAMAGRPGRLLRA